MQDAEMVEAILAGREAGMAAAYGLSSSKTLVVSPGGLTITVRASGLLG